MRALITGGAGFIGSHLVEALLDRGHDVWVIDDLSTGSRSNLPRLETTSRFRFTHGTILDYKTMKRLVGWSDVIYHLAAAVGVKYVIENVLHSIRVNVRGTEIILDLASKRGQKVVLSSTSEIYGKSTSKFFKETDDRVLGPTTINRWSYSCTKAIDEFLALAFHREEGLPVIIVRLFNTCGPRQTGRYGMVLPRFIEQALRGEPITVYGDGKQTRSFTFVGDVVDAMMALVEEPRAVGEIFNIGSSEGIAIGQLALLVKKLTGSRSEIVHIPYAKAYDKGFEDMRHRVPDISKIKALIGYKATLGLEDIIKLTIADMRRRLTEGRR